MRLTLLGVGEAFAPEPNSSALVEAGGFTLLIDCGHGTLPPLWRARPEPDSIDAVYLTHHHADHILGLVPLIDKWAVGGRKAPFSIYTTPEGIVQLQRLFEAMSAWVEAFPIRYEVSADVAQIGPFGVRVAATEHTLPNQAIRLERNGRKLAWSGDGRPTPESLALYADADLLMHECYFPQAETARYHCDLPTVRAIQGPPRIGVYHVRDGERDVMRAALADDARLFMPEAGEVLEP